MGSYLLYDAYFTDIPAPEDTWRSVQNREECRTCKACIKNCPTGAILQERFLIDNQRCLSAINEMPGEFPDWLPKSVHHTLYDCLRCQEICPINLPYQNNVLRGIRFNETETAMLLESIPYEEFSPEMKEKSSLLGLNRWLEAIPRNLRALLEQE
jgi:epoxyqueuosine reductase